MIETREQLAELQAKAAQYALLAQAFNYPAEELVQRLAGGEFTEVLEDALEAVLPGNDSLRHALEELKKEYAHSSVQHSVVLLELEKDYTRMFFASKPRLAHLFESVYREGKLLQESTFDIARLYVDAGLQLKEDFRLPPDHIAVELEFVSFLYFKELEALNAGNHENAEYARELQDRVLRDHLRPFAANLAERVVAHARTTFYRCVAQILRECCAE
jgi:TorA maturation chaperone TorD